MISIAILGILFLVFIHEIGHFLIARWYGIAVEKFSVGFGPRIFSYTSRKTGTEWQLSVIPLGGYVKFYEQTEYAPFGQIGFQDAPPLAKLATAFAGPLFNLLFALCVILGFNYQQGIHPAKLAAPIPDTAIFKAGITEQITVKAIGYNNQMYRVQTFSELMRHIENAVGQEQNIILQNADDQNYLVNYYDMTNIVSIQTPKQAPQQASSKQSKPSAIQTPQEIRVFSSERLGIAAPINKATIKAVKKDEAAAFLGFKAGQDIQKINDVPFNNPYLLKAAQKKNEPFKVTVTEKGTDQKIIIKDIIVDQAVLKQKFANSPLNQKNQKLQKEISDKMKIPAQALPANFSLGIEIKNHRADIQSKTNPLLLIEQSLSELTYRTLEQFSAIVSSIFGLKTENMSSIIGISQVLGEGAETGWMPFLGLLSILSIGLACINLLPIPLLDGWHILTALIEVIFKKPLPKAVNEAFQRFGLMFLLFIFLSSLLQDIFKIAA
jgi:regulator of sigma E protease